MRLYLSIAAIEPLGSVLAMEKPYDPNTTESPNLSTGLDDQG